MTATDSAGPVDHADQRRLDGQVAVINGATQGLGEAVARLFVTRGAAAVVVCGRNAERGERVCADLIAAGADAWFQPVELSEAGQVAGVMPAVDARHGRVDVLVNAAALTDRGTLTHTTVEDWDRMQAINVRAPFQLIQGAVSIMRREAIAGRIVNVGSVSGYGSLPTLLPYAVSKAGLMTLTKNAAYSVMRDQIRINTVNLGWMNTPNEHRVQIEAEGAAEDWLVEAAAAQPFGRLIDPAEAARAIAFLASEESGLMTGACIDYDQSVIGAGQQPVPGPEVRG